MPMQDHWRGRARYTVFDSEHGDGARVAALIAAWRADPQRPQNLHIVALASDLQPGFHRIPQAEAGITLDLLRRRSRTRWPSSTRTSISSGCTTQPAAPSHARWRA